MRLVMAADTALVRSIMPIRVKNAGAWWERMRGRDRWRLTTYTSRLGQGHCAAAAHTLSQ